MWCGVRAAWQVAPWAKARPTNWRLPTPITSIFCPAQRATTCTGTRVGKDSSNRLRLHHSHTRAVLAALTCRHGRCRTRPEKAVFVWLAAELLRRALGRNIHTPHMLIRRMDTWSQLHAACCMHRAVPFNARGCCCTITCTHAPSASSESRSAGCVVPPPPSYIHLSQSGALADRGPRPALAWLMRNAACRCSDAACMMGTPGRCVEQARGARRSCAGLVFSNDACIGMQDPRRSTR